MVSSHTYLLHWLFISNFVMQCMQLEEKCKEYNALENKGSEEAKELYLEILYNIPTGFQLTARMTTNYSQIKPMYEQRKNHRLPEWREFCEYMKNNLPLFKELTGIE